MPEIDKLSVRRWYEIAERRDIIFPKKILFRVREMSVSQFSDFGKLRIFSNENFVNRELPFGNKRKSSFDNLKKIIVTKTYKIRPADGHTLGGQ
jgi:hypothetical protein